MSSSQLEELESVNNNRSLILLSSIFRFLLLSCRRLRPRLAWAGLGCPPPCSSPACTAGTGTGCRTSGPRGRAVPLAWTQQGAEHGTGFCSIGPKIRRGAGTGLREWRGAATGASTTRPSCWGVDMASRMVMLSWLGAGLHSLSTSEVRSRHCCSATIDKQWRQE